MRKNVKRKKIVNRGQWSVTAEEAEGYTPSL
jgi:hypothetical protein